MTAQYILMPLGFVFLLMGGLRMVRDAGQLKAPATTWLLVGGIFSLVSIWLCMAQQ